MAGREALDLRGVPCPQNAARAILRLEGMGPGEVLELAVDDGEPYANLPPALKEEGHEILSARRRGASWLIRVRRTA